MKVVLASGSQSRKRPLDMNALRSRNFAHQISSLEDRGLHDYVRRYPVLRYAGALEGDSVLRFATPSQAATTLSPRCRKPPGRLLREQGVEVQDDSIRQ